MSAATAAADASAPSRGGLLALAAVVAGGLALRCLFLGDKALWLDEAYSVWSSQQSWHDLWSEVPRYETHPPLYYSLLKLWRIFGSGEGTLRALSALASGVTVALVALAAAIAAPAPQRRAAATAAAVLFAVSPLQLALAQEARPYALLMLGMALALAGAAWLVTHPAQAAQALWRRHSRSWPVTSAYGALGLGSATLLWMHNLGIVYAAALAVALAAWCAAQPGRATLFANLTLAALLSAALYSPNLPTLLLQVTVVARDFWLQAPSAPELVVLLFQIYGQWQQLFGEQQQQIAVQMLLAVPLAILGLCALRQFCERPGDRRWTAWLLLCAAFAPLLLMLAVTYGLRPVLMNRTLAAAQVPWAVICAFAPCVVERRWRPLVWGLIGAIALLNVAGFIASQATDERRDAERPWRAITASISASSAPDTPIFVVPNSSALVLDYYRTRLEVELAIHPLPARYPARDDNYRYPSGARGEAAVDERVLPDLDARSENVRSVWLITRLEDLFDPTQIVRRALSARFPCAATTVFGPISVTRFDRTCP